MKRTILSILAMLFVTLTFAQSPLNGTYYNRELNIRMKLHLDSANIPVPGLEVDSCYGYITGNINSMWVILKVKKSDSGKALVRAMCEKGDNAQDLELTLSESGEEISFRQVDETFIKGIKDRKYVKLPKLVILKKE